MRRAYWVVIALALIVVSCTTNLRTRFVESIVNYSNYSTVNWKNISEKYYRSNHCDWNDSMDSLIIDGFPKNIAGHYWHLLQNARIDFHKKSLPLRAEASEDIIKALDKTEAMFDTVFVRCVSQEYYLRLFPEMYNEVMGSAIDELTMNLNRE